MDRVDLTPRTYGLAYIDEKPFLETYWRGRLEYREQFDKIDLCSDRVDIIFSGSEDGIICSFGIDVSKYIVDFAERYLIEIDNRVQGPPF